MDELVAAGARLRAAAPTPAPKFERVAERAKQHQRRRKFQAATAGALAVVAAAVGVWAGVHSSRNTVQVQVPTSQEHVEALSPQMRAHLGLNAPKGWVPVDVGSVRVYVPPASIFGCQPGGRCVGRTIDLRERPQDHTNQFLSIQTPTATETQGNRAGTINGYAVREVGSGSIGNPYGVPIATWHTYTVPALRAVVTVSDGTDAQRAFRTLGPSARTVVFDASTTPVSTAGWRAVRDQGVSFRVPPNWSVIDAETIPPCTGPRSRWVVVGKYRGSLPSCFNANPAGSGGVTNVVLDSIGTIGGIAANTQPPFHKARVAGRSLDFMDDFAIPDNAVAITVDGQHGIVFDLGEDGRVDAAVIASLRYEPDNS